MRRSIPLLLVSPAILASPLSAAPAEPPRVVRTLPEDGQAPVPADLAEIVVVFDRPMVAGFSWTGGGETFPELTGRPVWRDDRTAVLPVRLAPGRDYLIGLNSPSRQNFRSVEGVPLEPRPLRFSTRDLATTPEENDAVIARLGELLTTQYSYRDRLGIDWPERLEAARAELRDAPSSLALAIRLDGFLAGLEDPHVHLTLGAFRFATDERARPTNFDPQAWLRAGVAFREHGAGVRSADLGEGVAGVFVPTWTGQGGAQPGEAAVAALRDVQDARALIIDVRPNGGGDEHQARLLAGCFVDEPVVYAKRRVLDPEAPDGFTPPLEILLAPNADAPRFRGPVFVLTGPGAMSSNEAFLLMMRAAGATLVGLPSAGSSGRPLPHDLGEGIEILLPSWQALTADGEPIEGVGVRPDVLVEATAPFPGPDPVVQEALHLACEAIRGSEERADPAGAADHP